MISVSGSRPTLRQVDAVVGEGLQVRRGFSTSRAPGARAAWSMCRRGEVGQRLLVRIDMADFLLAAWFLWITPLLAALSSARDAARSATAAFSLSPASAASRNLRMDVFSADFTDLLRWRRFSFCLIRLIWDLIFATREPRRFSLSDSVRAARYSTGRGEPGYQPPARPPKRRRRAVACRGAAAAGGAPRYGGQACDGPAWWRPVSGVAASGVAEAGCGVGHRK